MVVGIQRYWLPRRGSRLTESGNFPGSSESPLGESNPQETIRRVSVADSAAKEFFPIGIDYRVFFRDNSFVLWRH